jgi:hypothetical protein
MNCEKTATITDRTSRARIGRQVSGGTLVIWSFLIVTAHGAGLILLLVV